MQFAILVSTIIAILLGSFLTLSQTHIFFTTQSRILLNVIDSANAGIEYSLKKEHVIADSLSIEGDFYNTKIKINSWGGYLKVESIAAARSKSFTKTALIGSKVARPALGIYLSEDKLPLVLVGYTVIEGDAYVSDMGIKPGIISGHYYNGNELVKGKISSGKGLLPEMDPVWLNDLRKLQEYIPVNSDEVIQREAINTNSFFEKTHFVYEEDKIVLNETHIGNIVIKSETEIVITSSAQLTDVMLVAPRITIEKGFTGSASFFAEERITLAENVKLDYPSSLIVINTKNDESKPVPKGEEPISIADGSIVEGTVIYLDEREEKSNGSMNSVAHVAIAPLARINGYVYCEGNVELKGTVTGAIYTKRFLAREFGSVYINHIYNGKVLGRDLDPAFGGLPFKESDKAVVKWLY